VIRQSQILIHSHYKYLVQNHHSNNNVELNKVLKTSSIPSNELYTESIVRLTIGSFRVLLVYYIHVSVVHRES